MQTDQFNLLDPKFLDRARALRIMARRVAPAGRWADHRSRDRGQGLEFRDYRPYSPGDEMRSIDWNIYQRLGRVVIRLFEEMEDLPIYLLPDLSHSMWNEEQPRALVAMQAAIGLAAIGLDQHDRVGIFPFGEELDVSVRPTSGKGRITVLADALTRMATTAKEKKSGTDLAAAISRFNGLGLREGLVVVLSDFFDPNGAESVLRELKGSRHKPLFVAISRPQDREPDLSGDVRVKDCETGQVSDVSVNEAVLARYRDAYDQHFATLQTFVQQRQGGWLQIDAESDVMDQLASLCDGGRFVA